MYLKYSTRKIGERGGLVVRALDSGVRGRGFDPHSGRHIVSFQEQDTLFPKSTGNTQEAVAPSRHD